MRGMPLNACLSFFAPCDNALYLKKRLVMKMRKRIGELVHRKSSMESLLFSLILSKLMPINDLVCSLCNTCLWLSRFTQVYWHKGVKLNYSCIELGKEEKVPCQVHKWLLFPLRLWSYDGLMLVTWVIIVLIETYRRMQVVGNSWSKCQCHEQQNKEKRRKK